jgi:hypothetical protein
MPRLWLFHLSIPRTLIQEDNAKLKEVRDPVRHVKEMIVTIVLAMSLFAGKK